jgi:hypothetical protein
MIELIGNSNVGKFTKIFVLMSICTVLTACLGTAVGIVVDTTIEVVKIPFKVGGAIIDVAIPDKDEEQKKPKRSKHEEADGKD